MDFETLPRQGASHELPADDSDLPMVVWLRGDEEIIDEFTMDAEAAMTALGIKRSRLTQISGRELRVGRIRIDRYTRPVYRPKDVDAYLEWTRASVSHQKSSQAIEMAAQKLDEQRGELGSSLQASFDRFECDLMDRWTLLDRQRERLTIERAQRLEETLATRDRERTKSEARATEALGALACQVDLLEKSLARRDGFLESLLKGFYDLKEEVRANQVEATKRLELQDLRLEREIAHIDALVRDAAEKDRALWQDIALRLTTMQKKQKKKTRAAVPLPKKTASRARRARQFSNER